MAKCKACDPHELCEECPEWIFTLADLLMCMMGLFVILWVLKPGPKPEDKQQANEDLVKVIAAIREAFNYLPDPQSTDPVDIQILLNKLEKMKPLQGPGDGGRTHLPRRGAEGTDPEVTSIRVGKQAAVGGRILFEAGQLQLTPSARHDLDQIAGQIRGHRNIVMVKGHTSMDDFADGTGAEQKMDLSLRRAQAVADYLVARGVEPDILRVQGCSTFEPVVKRAYSPTSQSSNRRAEVEATATLVADLQDTPAGAVSVPPAPTTPPTNAAMHP